MQNNNMDRIWLKEWRTLNEVQKRRFAAIKAKELGWGGVTKVCNLTRMSHNTIDKGIKEIDDKKIRKLHEGRLRKKGGGRKKIVDKQPKIKKVLETILDENTAGDPMSSILWTNKSTGALANELNSRGYSISADTVGLLLKELTYRLKANIKSKEDGTTDKRDSQFRYINKEIKRCSDENIPAISVDAKKKELIGNFKNPGRRWLKKGQAEIVNVYDFESLSEGKAIPYGIFDVVKNKGFVNIGVSGNTSEFAVESIMSWWKNIGRQNYPNTKELLICADGGGSNSSRSRLWKYYLHKFATETGLKITTCHYPPGTSKWNKIEHKMFSFISINWRGKPLRNYEIIINLIENTKTKTGLKISAKIDKKTYETGKKIDKTTFKKIKIQFHSINPDWNYTIN